MKYRKRNPNQFTTDRIRTADLIITEGHLGCAKKYDHPRLYTYPRIVIGMCDREALEPASRTLKVGIIANKLRQIQCPPTLFPPDGKGYWKVEKWGKPAQKAMQQLAPLLTEHTRKKWQETLKRCR